MFPSVATGSHYQGDQVYLLPMSSSCQQCYYCLQTALCHECPMCCPSHVHHVCGGVTPVCFMGRPHVPMTSMCTPLYLQTLFCRIGGANGSVNPRGLHSRESLGGCCCGYCLKPNVYSPPPCVLIAMVRGGNCDPATVLPWSQYPLRPLML